VTHAVLCVSRRVRERGKGNSSRLEHSTVRNDLTSCVLNECVRGEE